MSAGLADRLAKAAKDTHPHVQPQPCIDFCGEVLGGEKFCLGCEDEGKHCRGCDAHGQQGAEG